MKEEVKHDDFGYAACRGRGAAGSRRVARARVGGPRRGRERRKRRVSAGSARGGKPRRSSKARGKEETAAEPAAEEKKAEPEDKGEDDRPQVMGSAERRTDEHREPLGAPLPRPAAKISDEELSFSMAPREPRAAPLARTPEPPPARIREPVVEYTPRYEEEPEEERVLADLSEPAELEPLDEEQEEIAELDHLQAQITELGSDEGGAGGVRGTRWTSSRSTSRALGERSRRAASRDDRGGSAPATATIASPRGRGAAPAAAVVPAWAGRSR